MCECKSCQSEVVVALSVCVFVMEIWLDKDLALLLTNAFHK